MEDLNEVKKCLSRSFDGSHADTTTIKTTRCRKSTGSVAAVMVSKSVGLSDDEKLRIACEVLEGGKKIATVAREHQIPESTLRGWLKRRRKLAISPANNHHDEEDGRSAKRRKNSIPKRFGAPLPQTKPDHCVTNTTISPSGGVTISNPSPIDLEIASVLDSIRQGGRALEELACAEALTRLRHPTNEAHDHQNFQQYDSSSGSPSNPGPTTLLNIAGTQSPWSQRHSEPVSPPATRCQLHPLVLKNQPKESHVEDDKENSSQPIDLVKRPDDASGGEDMTLRESNRKQALDSGIKLLGWLRKLSENRVIDKEADGEMPIMKVDRELVDQFQIMVDNLKGIDENGDKLDSDEASCSSCACHQHLGPR